MALFLVPIDLNQNEIRNALAHLLGVDPSAVEGQFWYDTTNHYLKFRTDTATIVLGRLDQISAPLASLNLNSQKIVNLLDPTAAQDAATKNYVDVKTAAGTFAFIMSGDPNSAIVTGDDGDYLTVG